MHQGLFAPQLDLLCAAGSLVGSIIDSVRWRRGKVSGWWPVFWMALTLVFLAYAVGERLGVIG